MALTVTIITSHQRLFGLKITIVHFYPILKISCPAARDGKGKNANAVCSNAGKGFVIAGSNAVKAVQLIVNNDKLNKHNDVEEGQYWPLVGLTLGSFLQVIAMDQQTCLLEICHTDGERGRFFFIQGSLYDAQCGDLEGEEAAMELVSWEGVRFVVKKIPEDAEIPRRINKSLISLLMESTRLRDETGRDSSAGPEESEEISNSGDAKGAGSRRKGRTG